MGLKAKAPRVQKKVLNNNPDSKLTAIIDGDYCAFPVASVGDELYIEVKNKKTGKSKEFKNRSEFYGRSRKTLGGWLGEINKKRERQGKPLYTVDDFTIEDKQRRKQEYKITLDSQGHEIKTPINMDKAKANIFHSAKTVILSDLKSAGIDNYKMYLGKSGRIREDISTLLQYKGNRKDSLKPILLDDVINYIGDAFEAEGVEYIETDDKVVIEAYGDPNKVIIGVDKDFYGQPVRFFNVNKPEDGIIDCDCFGELTNYNSKNSKVEGYGRIFLYWQLLAGDSSDNYKPNCFSDIKYGNKGAYDDLVDCKDDKEALEKVIEVYKRLYPEPKVVTGWRGNQFLIDWLYVLREMFQLAAMMRWHGDYRSIDCEFERFGVEYEYTSKPTIEINGE